MEDRVQSRLRSIVPWNRPGRLVRRGLRALREKRSAYRPGFPQYRPFPSDFNVCARRAGTAVVKMTVTSWKGASAPNGFESRESQGSACKGMDSIAGSPPILFAGGEEICCIVIARSEARNLPDGREPLRSSAVEHATPREGRGSLECSPAIPVIRGEEVRYFAPPDVSARLRPRAHGAPTDGRSHLPRRLGLARSRIATLLPPCGRRWRHRASKTPVFRRAMAPDEGLFSMIVSAADPHPNPLPHAGEGAKLGDARGSDGEWLPDSTPALLEEEEITPSFDGFERVSMSAHTARTQPVRRWRRDLLHR